jgi:peptide/nickel transport system ATP-binding protein
MPSLLDVSDLTVRFRTAGPLSRLLSPGRAAYIEAVSGVTFSLPPATTFGLVGESGSGKTTLGRALIGLVPPSGGEIRFEGQERPRSSPSAPS